jgi:hypothetical protein
MKKLTLWLVIAMLLVSASSVFADHHEYSYMEKWDGRGSDSERCGYYDENRDPAIGWIHWIFSTKGASTDAKLYLMDLDGNLLGDSPYMPAEPLNASVWHFFTPYFELAELQAKIELFGGLPGKGGGLVISDFCPGGEKVMLDVEKTAYTSFTRTHDWDIAKKVETEKEHMLDGFPKIWLYTDGMGDEKATWTIDVTYLGYKDTEHKVWGDITIENIGKADAKIVDIMDWLIPFDPMGTPIPAKVTCGGEELSAVLPYDLAVGMKLECKYSHMFDPDEAFEGYNYAEVITDEDKMFYDDADIIWGDPDPDLHAVVNVKDPMFALDEMLDAYDYEMGDVIPFVFHKDFMWADYGKDKCGHHEYKNTATLTSEDGLDKYAKATLLVNVQCMIFKGETAWAANGHTAGSLRYTKQGNWATYVKYDGVKKITTLFAGQTIPVGKVYFSPPTASGKVKITVKMATPWEYEQVKENLKVQDYSKCTDWQSFPGSL